MKTKGEKIGKKKKKGISFKTIVAPDIFRFALPFRPAKGLERQIGRQSAVQGNHSALWKTFFKNVFSCVNQVVR